jgi:hypothetical protein
MIVMIMAKTPPENAASVSGEDTFLFAMACPTKLESLIRAR